MRQAHGVSGVDELARVAWHVSSRSTDNGPHCVEAGSLGDGSGRVAVRHSRRRDASAFVYVGEQWQAFVTATKHGTFDFHGLP